MNIMKKIVRREHKTSKKHQNGVDCKFTKNIICGLITDIKPSCRDNTYITKSVFKNIRLEKKASVNNGISQFTKSIIKAIHPKLKIYNNQKTCIITKNIIREIETMIKPCNTAIIYMSKIIRISNMIRVKF